MIIDREALEELKRICREDFNRDLSDTEAQDIGNRIIRFLRNREILEKTVWLSEKEEQAFKFIKDAVEAGNSTSVRSIASELGFSSSRSGQRVVDSLIVKKRIYRDDHGVLTLLP